MVKNRSIITILLAAIVGVTLFFTWKLDALNEKIDRGAISVTGVRSVPALDRDGKNPYLTGPVKNTIRKRSGDIKKIYLEYLEGSPEKADGKIEIDWQIDPSGNVLTPEVIFSGFGGGELERKILRAISSWKFPPPPSGRKSYVAHKFLLKKEE